MKKLNRRNLLKRTLALIGVGSVIVGEKSEGAVCGAKTGTRAVQYGKAQYDYPKGHGLIGITRNDVRYKFCLISYEPKWLDHVMVIVLKPIKKGQALIWHPDGTITGGEYVD